MGGEREKGGMEGRGSKHHSQPYSNSDLSRRGEREGREERDSQPYSSSDLSGGEKEGEREGRGGRGNKYHSQS